MIMNTWDVTWLNTATCMLWHSYMGQDWNPDTKLIVKLHDGDNFFGFLLSTEQAHARLQNLKPTILFWAFLMFIRDSPVFQGSSIKQMSLKVTNYSTPGCQTPHNLEDFQNEYSKVFNAIKCLDICSTTKKSDTASQLHVNAQLHTQIHCKLQ